MVISFQDWREGRNPSQPLGDLDWKVVETARTDGPRSQNPNGFLAWLIRTLVGAPVAPALADAKLEALRRFSVRAWYWDLIRTKDIQAFLGAGYSRINVLEILSHIGMARGFTPSVEYETSPTSFRARSKHSRCG
jgi:hypothetical protein